MLTQTIVKPVVAVVTDMLTQAILSSMWLQLPQSYLVMDKKLTKMAEEFKDGRRPLYLTQEEFDDLLRSEPLADFDTFDDQHLGERNFILTEMTMKGLV